MSSTLPSTRFVPVPITEFYSLVRDLLGRGMSDFEIAVWFGWLSFQLEFWQIGVAVPPRRIVRDVAEALRIGDEPTADFRLRQWWGYR